MLDGDELDIDKLKTVPVDLSKLSNVVKNNVVKTTAYNKLVKKVNAIQTINARDLVEKSLLQHRNWRNWKENF